MEYKYHHNPPYESGDEIRLYQDRLNYIRNTYHYGWDYINVDGIFGRRTRNAVKGFNVTFSGISGEGNLDEKTQSLITSKFFECQRGYSADPGVARGYNPNVSYVDQGYADIANYTMGEQTYKRSGTRPPTETENKAHKPGDDEGFTIEYFKTTYVDPAYGFVCDIVSIVQAIIDLPVKDIWGTVVTRVKALIPKIQYFILTLQNDIARFFKLVGQKATELGKWFQRHGEQLVKSVKSDPNKAQSLSKGAKSAAKGNIVGIVLAALPLIYYIIMWLACDPSQNDYYKAKAWEAFKSFVGALILMALIELAAAGIVAAGIASAPVAIVAAIIGLVVAIVDIIVMLVTDKGLGDWIMVGLDKFGGLIADCAETVAQTVKDAASTTVEIFSDGLEWWGETLGIIDKQPAVVGVSGNAR